MVIVVVATVVGSAASLVEVVTAFLIFPPQPGLTWCWLAFRSRNSASGGRSVPRSIAGAAGWLIVCRCGLLCWSGPRLDAMLRRNKRQRMKEARRRRRLQSEITLISAAIQEHNTPNWLHLRLIPMARRRRFDFCTLAQPSSTVGCELTFVSVSNITPHTTNHRHSH